MLASLLARTAQAMSAVVIVLFALERFHSAPVAGLAVFASSVPGLLLSPFAGALLDRHHRIRLVRLDYGLTAATLLTVTLLDATGRLTPALLLLILALGSLSLPLSQSGTRSLFPLMVPSHLWDRANAVDSAGYVVASIVGPALGGVLAGAISPRAAIAAVAVLYAGAVAGLLGMREPPSPRAAQPHLLRAGLQGVRYVFASHTLRSIALVTTIINLAVGVVTVALPVLVISRLGGGDTTVGLLWALAGVTGIVGVTLTGRVDTTGREGRLMTAAVLGQAVGFVLVVLATLAGGGLVLAAAGMAVFGVTTGPYDVAMFSLRQRSTDPAWMGRAFAVSMSLNWVGMPVASAIAGPAVTPHLTATLASAAVVSLVAAGLAAWLLGRGATPRRYNDRLPAAR